MPNAFCFKEIHKKLIVGIIFDTMVGETNLRELRGKRLLGYSIGDFGFSLVTILIGTFIFQFYVYTVNLNALLVSTGISFNFLISAIISIIFGVVVDNKKPGKFGKRRPFLLIGLPIWFLIETKISNV